jgi:hypothetical protein
MLNTIEDFDKSYKKKRGRRKGTKRTDTEEPSEDELILQILANQSSSQSYNK